MTDNVTCPGSAWTIYRFDDVTSTNRILWDLFDQGASAGTVAIARQQSAGRGQWGRQWRSPPGGLYLSLGLTPDLVAEQAGQLTIMSAWGIATALRHYGIPVLLKWPNDLVAQGRKLGGILTETRLHNGRIRQAVVGVGINWMNPVPDTGITLHTLLSHHTPTIGSLEELAAIVLTGIMDAYQIWQTEGIAAILPPYHQLLANQGHLLTIDGCPGEVVGVSSTGDLQVRLQLQKNPLITVEVCLKPGMVSLGYERVGTE